LKKRITKISITNHLLTIFNFTNFYFF